MKLLHFIPMQTKTRHKNIDYYLAYICIVEIVKYSPGWNNFFLTRNKNDIGIDIFDHMYVVSCWNTEPLSCSKALYEGRWHFFPLNQCHWLYCLLWINNTSLIALVAYWPCPVWPFNISISKTKTAHFIVIIRKLQPMTCHYMISKCLTGGMWAWNQWNSQE